MSGNNYNRGGRRDNRGSRDNERWEFTNEHQNNLKKWIGEKFDTDTINYAEKFGKYLAKNRLTSSQMRIIYGEVKRIEASVMGLDKGEDQGGNIKDFLLLRPKIAYAAKRSGTRGIEDLRKVMDVAHGAVNVEDEDKFKQTIENFADFFESILAYHKAYGGRE